MNKKYIIISLSFFLSLGLLLTYGFYITDFSGISKIEQIEQKIDKKINDNKEKSNNNKLGIVINDNISLVSTDNTKRIKKTVLTEIIKEEERGNTIEKKLNVFILGNGIKNNNKIIKYTNQYIKNIYSQKIKNINFFKLNSKSYGNCIDDFKIKKIKKYNPFDNLSKKLKILNLLEYIKNIDKNNNTLYIINGENLDYNCNNIDELKLFFIKNRNKTFSNVIITKGKNTKKINDIFFNNISLYSGIKIIKINDIYEYENLLNKKIYRFNKTGISSEEKNINTKIYFYDKDENLYAGELKIYKKTNGTFKLIQRNNVSMKFYGELLPGIYYFEGYDPISKIRYTTDPITINNNNKYSHNFIFRETKLEIKIMDKNGRPILSNIKLKYEGNIERFNTNYNKKSNIILYGKPGKYKLDISVVGTNDNFSESFILSGEKSIVKEYKTIPFPVSIKIFENSVDNIKNNVIISIIKNGQIIDQKGGGRMNTLLSNGTYIISAKDVNSGIIISKTININQNSGSSSVEIIFSTKEVIFEIGREPRIIKLYSKDSYPDKAISSFSGTGLKKMKLIPGKYILEIFNINKELLEKRNISIDAFFDNTFQINTEI